MATNSEWVIDAIILIIYIHAERQRNLPSGYQEEFKYKHRFKSSQKHNDVIRYVELGGVELGDGDKDDDNGGGDGEGDELLWAILTHIVRKICNHHLTRCALMQHILNVLLPIPQQKYVFAFLAKF